ncbi:MAG: RHS repeat-associated core domain-containing protein [Clostridia bacterium]|nr:RHS repeat-associated core domain-containing protein [Clostridia bacterium]
MVKYIQGDVIGVYNSSGTKLVTFKYDAYGNCSVSGDASLASYCKIRYRGYYFDTETGLYWVQTRYYNPEWCRWISPDTLSYLDPETAHGLNLYAYAGYKPVRSARGTKNSVGNNSNSSRINNCSKPLDILNEEIHENKNVSSVYWKNEIISTGNPQLLVFSINKGALIDWNMSIYKGTLHFGVAENPAIFVGVGNISAFVGYNVKENKYGVFADANVLSFGYDGRYVDASVSVVGVGFILSWEGGKFRFKFDPPGWFGFDISIDFGQIIEDIFG